MHQKKQNRTKKVIAGCIYDLKTKADGTVRVEAK